MTGRRKIEKTDILKRQLDAVDLRKQGKSYRYIAERLGVSFQQAHRDIQNELKRLADLNVNSTEELRQLELERLDRIIDGLDHWVQAGDAKAAMAMLKAVDARAKLLGLYAPQKIEGDFYSWEDRAIADIKAGRVTFKDLADAFDQSLAARLFTAAGVPVSSK